MRVLLWQQVTRDLDLKMIGDTPVVVVLQILSLRSISHKNRRARYIPQSPPPLSEGVIQGGWASLPQEVNFRRKGREECAQGWLRFKKHNSDLFLLG